MAQRRMFSKDITNSSEFQMMSPSAQSLYFHIGMNADDDGFCEVFTIVRMTESKPDDLNALHARGFIYMVDSKVGIVKDWHTNNDIRSDRYTQSKYLSESANPLYRETYLTIMDEKIKKLSRYSHLISDGITTGITTGITQDRIGKDRIGIFTKVNKDDKSSESVKTENKTYGDPHVSFVIELFIKRYGFSPIDKQPRRVAHNLISSMQKEIRLLGKDPLEVIPEYGDRTRKGLTAFFVWVATQNSLEGAKTLDVIRRNLPLWLKGISR